jgi:hypothetical protein
MNILLSPMVGWIKIETIFYKKNYIKAKDAGKTENFQTLPALLHRGRLGNP